MKIIMLLMLSVESYTDIKKRQIDIRLIVFTVLFAVSCMYASTFSTFSNSLMNILLYNPSPANIIFGMIPGISMYLICSFSKEKVGEGDALAIMAVGIILGLTKGCIVIMIGFLLAAAVSIIAMLVFKKDKDYSIPLLPFLLASYVICLINVI